MILRRWLASVILFALANAAGAAPAQTAKSTPPVTFDLATSVTTTPFARNLASALQEQRLHLRLQNVGSERAIDEVRAGNVDAALISRALTSDEARDFQATTLAMDSLLVIVNERNPLENADRALIRRIFSREFGDWRQVGAGGSGTIVPVTRRPSDGTRTVFDNAFGIGRVIPTGIVELASNLAAVLYIAADPQAIGYVSAETYDDALRRGLHLRAVKLDGMAPAAAACKPDSYPLCRPIVLIRRPGKAPAGHAQIEQFLHSPEGRALLEQYGFAPVSVP